MRRAILSLSVLLGLAWVALGAQSAPLDRAAERWVQQTLKRLTIDARVGQLLMPGIESTYLASDSDEFQALARLVQGQHVGGVILFGGTQAAPGVLLNPTYNSVTLGQPLAAASLVNRLQALADVPLLTASDFETGVGMRIAGGTAFPRAMAFGAAADEQLVYDAAKATAVEGRALGVHVNLAPVADVNNNPRNPVINTRSFGGSTITVGSMVAAYVRGLRDGGMIATLKHFPGHGDTDVDSHLGLPVITHPRARLDEVELPPFRQGIGAGAGAVMSAHIGLPSIDPAPDTPATFSRVVIDLLRKDLGFRGLTITDSMKMNAVTRLGTAGENAVRAFRAGHDLILDTVLADVPAAHAALKAAVESGVIARAELDAAVERILRAKARVGLHRTRLVSLDAVAASVGGRQHRAVAQAASEQSITLVEDDHGVVPLTTPRGAAVLYLSILDYPSGWFVAAPGRTLVPELRKRWSNVTAIELSDRSTPAEIDLVRTSASRYDAIIAGIYVRASSASGRMDLSPPLIRLLQDLARISANSSRAGAVDEALRPLAEQGAARGVIPLVSVFFGNPYQATFLPELPAVLLTYDFYDLAEQSAVRALAGEIPIRGHLPIPLPDRYPIGHGLMRDAAAPSPNR